VRKACRSVASVFAAATTIALLLLLPVTTMLPLLLAPHLGYILLRHYYYLRLA
jgi:hypothetical protein